MHHRLPTVRPPTLIGCHNGERSSENRRSIPRRAFSASSSATDLYLKNRAMKHQRTEDRGRRTEDRGRRTEDRGQSSLSYCPLSSVLCPLSGGGGLNRNTNRMNSTVAPKHWKNQIS